VPLGDQAAATEDQDRVDGLSDLGEDVAADQHRSPGLRERAQEGAEPVHAGRIEAVRGLVEDQQLRIAEQRGGQPQALAHPERVGAHGPVRRVGQLDERQNFLHAGDVDARRQRQSEQVIAPRPAGVEVVGLQQGAHAPARLLEQPVGPAEHCGGPRRRRGEAEDQPQRRRLPGAIRPQQARDRPRHQGERQAVNRDNVAIALRQPRGAQRTRNARRRVTG